MDERAREGGNVLRTLKIFILHARQGPILSILPPQHPSENSTLRTGGWDCTTQNKQQACRATPIAFAEANAEAGEERRSMLFGNCPAK